MDKNHHLKLGAKFALFRTVESVAEYDLGAEAEYQIAKQSVGLMDRSYWGRIQLSGIDRLDFLQRMTTNDCKLLVTGYGLQTILTTPEAKIIELLTVYGQTDSLLCLTHPLNALKVFNWFRRNIFFRDKVKPVDVSQQTIQLSLFGPLAHRVIEDFAQQSMATLPSFHSRSVRVNECDIVIARVPYIAGGGYDVIAPVEYAETMWDALMECGSPLGLKLIGAQAFNLLRLAAGQPLAGFELTEEHNPLEARLNAAVSFSKGCYTGQEVIARLDAYHKLKQVLVGIHLSVLPQNPLPLMFKLDGVEAGQVTSAAFLPDQNAVMALGYVRVKMNQVGAVIEVQDGDVTRQGTLLALPNT